jgi:hypothetical protein
MLNATLTRTYCNPHTLKIGWNGSPKDLAQNASQLAFLVRREFPQSIKPTPSTDEFAVHKLSNACGNPVIKNKPNYQNLLTRCLRCLGCIALFVVILVVVVS